MDIENSKAQMKKGVLEMCILSIISFKDVYASDIIESMKDANLLIVEGTLYPLLTRLKNDGLLAYRWEESKSGPPRKYYTITPLGNEFLGELQQGWNDLQYSVSNILQIKSNN
ncbi:MAG: lineage-specific thermal regulator protein [Bacteroidetes bacterium ADurb.Bin217]|nr:MAG: lineage-specific thermal regulator protein [Bacteroidetes bacterium ADurb.Bin217]